MTQKKTKDDEPTSSMDLNAAGKGPKRNPMKEILDRLRVQIAVWRVKWAWTYDKLRAKKLHYALPAVVLFPVALFAYTMFFSGKPEPRTVSRRPTRVRTQPPTMEDDWARPRALQPPTEAAPPPRPQANALTPPPPVEEPPPPPEKPAVRAAPAPPKAKATATAKTKATTKKTAVKSKSGAKTTKATAKAKKPAVKKRAVASKTTKAKAKKKKK